MCKDGETLNLEKDATKKVMDTVEKIEEFLPQILLINGQIKQNQEDIDRERKERKSEIGEVKDNYIDRFDDIKKTLEIIFKKIDNTDKWTKRLLVTILIASVLSNLITKLF